MMARLIVFSVFAILTAIAAQLFFGSAIFASADSEAHTISLQDVYKNETHEIAGIVSVPSDCHDVSLRSRDLDARTTVLVFETWESPAANCTPDQVAARAVHAIVFAPPETQFRAIYDGDWVPLTMVRSIAE